MGAVSAKNEINSAINTAISVLNSSTQTCGTSLSIEQIIEVTGCSTVTISNINFNAIGVLDTACSQKNSSNTDISNKVTQVMTQAANAINQSLSLNPNSTEAQNIVNAMINIGIAVQNVYSQSCVNSSAIKQGVRITECNNASIQGVNFDAYSKAVSSCVQNSTSVTNLVNDLAVTIDQKATAEVAPLVSFGIILIVLILIYQ